jgi:hypothetical protein
VTAILVGGTVKSIADCRKELIFPGYRRHPSIWPSCRPMTIVPPSAFAKAVRAGLGQDTDALAVEPLVLGQRQQGRPDLGGGERKGGIQSVHSHRPHSEHIVYLQVTL